MTEAATLLTLLGQQTLLLSLSLLALTLLRPLLRRYGGAGAVLASWWAVPVVMLSPWLPAVTSLWPEAPALSWRIGTEALPSLAGLPAPQAAAHAWNWPTGLLLAWATGAGLLAALMLWQQRRFMRHGRRLPAGSSPAWVGLWRGQLCLPQDYRQRFDAQERRLIRAHERAHAQRGDNLWTLLAAGLWLIHWFNPLAWWALRRLRADQELAADAQVLRRHPFALTTYAKALAKTASPHTVLAAVSPFGSHPILERIRFMNRYAAVRTARPWLAWMTGLLMVGTAWALNGKEPASTLDAPSPPHSAVQRNQHAVPSDPRFVVDPNPSGSVTFDLRAFVDEKPVGHLQTQANWGEAKTFQLQGNPTLPIQGEVRAQALRDGKIFLSFEIDTGSGASRPRVVTANGTKATLEFNSAEDPRLVRLEITPRRVTP